MDKFPARQQHQQQHRHLNTPSLKPATFTAPPRLATTSPTNASTTTATNITTTQQQLHGEVLESVVSLPPASPAPAPGQRATVISGSSSRGRPGAALNRARNRAAAGPGNSNSSGSSGNRMLAAITTSGSVSSAGGDADRLFKMKQVLSEKLRNVAYDPNACREMCPVLSSAVLSRIQTFSHQQYKLVCVVSLGSLKEKPGVQFGSRCLTCCMLRPSSLVGKTLDS